jgi:hypothetical protein
MTDHGFELVGMAPAKEIATVLFPRSVLSAGQPYTRARNLRVYQDRIVVEVSENTVEDSGVWFVYELNLALDVVAVSPMDGVKATEAYRQLPVASRTVSELDVDGECDRLKKSVVVNRAL